MDGGLYSDLEELVKIENEPGGGLQLHGCFSKGKGIRESDRPAALIVGEEKGGEDENWWEKRGSHHEKAR